MFKPNADASKCLREGGRLTSPTLALEAYTGQDAHVVICGSEDQVRSVLPDAPYLDALFQILDGGERLQCRVELADGEWVNLIADLDDALGQVALNARRPLAVVLHPATQGGNPAVEHGNKHLPLHPRFEQELLVEIERYADCFEQYRDGSFKLIRQK
ncbi:MAG: hypothetical protein RLP15_02670 [Cryomorphaceae bacterium]